MAVTWGAWEYSGGNGMRVGIEITWETVTHSESGATATIEIWTENQYSYNDNQKLTYGGSISGSTDFNNTQGGAQTLRATKTYTYTYDSDEYGSSPGSRTFSASLSGAFNGVTPSVSKSSSIPARPYAAPAAQTSVSATYVSDTTGTVKWTRNTTAGAPYDSQELQQRANNGSWTTVTSSISGSATSYSDTNRINNKYEYRLRATNSAGTSGYSSTSNAIWTTPDLPTGATRTTSGANQVISWTNAPPYTEFSTEVWSSANDAAYTLLATVAGPGTSYTHSSPSTATRWKYKVRHKTTSGTTLYSAYSAETTQTAGTTSAPAAPTNLSPSGGQVLDPTVATTLTWQHNPTDTTAQTKYQVQHRVVGAGTWTQTAVITSSVSQHVLAANTYASGQNIEWQVATYGASATQGAWSASATVTYTAIRRLPVYMELHSGKLEAEIEHYANRAPVQRLYTASGTWTKPTGPFLGVWAEVQGGGGAGGGASATTAGETSPGPGGQGGHYARVFVPASLLGATETVTVGAGGTGVAGAAGGNGATSSFGPWVGAGGGTGGVLAGASTNPATAAGGTGTPAFSFSSSIPTAQRFTREGGDGWHGVRISGTFCWAGQGGSSFLGGGAVGPNGTSAAGNAGDLYGGGGSGARNTDAQSARAGGNGGAGCVVLTEVYG